MSQIEFDEDIYLTEEEEAGTQKELFRPKLDGEAYDRYCDIINGPYCFGIRLREEMYKRNITVQCLSEMSGVNQRSILRYIEEPRRGKNPSIPSVQNAALLANALGVSLDYLSGITNQPASDVRESEILSAVGLRRESVDVIHDITLNVERVIYGYYQVYCPWESRLIQDTIPDLRDSDYLYRFYGFQPTISETVESVFDPMNESLLRELFMSLQKCIVIRRELELEAQIRPEEEKWVRKHPEVKNQFDFNGIGALRQRLKKEERRLQFEIFSIVSELIDNLEMMFPVTDSERKAAVQTTEINHLLAEKRSKRDIEYMEETISAEEYMDAFYEEDEPLLWSVFEDGV